MKKRQNIFIASVIVATIAIILFLTFKPHKQLSQAVQKEVPVQTEIPAKTGYLSILYIENDSSAEGKSMMDFYTYDLDSGELDMKAKLPWQSQYSMGAVNLHDNKIYYTYREEWKIGVPDHLYAYDLTNGKSTLLETENRAYNDIIPLKNKLLITVKPVHAMIPGLFDLDTKSFSYLYKKKIMTSNGFKDFKYTTRPVALNYNYKYDNFINVYVNEGKFYDWLANSRKRKSKRKSIKYHISLIDSELNVKYKYDSFTLNSVDDELVTATQISPDSIIIQTAHDEYRTDPDAGYKYTFYKINFTDKTCKKIPSPFPKIDAGHSITLDEGNSYYILGHYNGRHGLYYYDCINDKVSPILLDADKEDSYVANYCLVEK